MGCDEPIAPTTAMLAAMKKSEQSIDRNRGAPDVRFRFVIMEVPSLSLTIRDHSHPSRFYPQHAKSSITLYPSFARSHFPGSGRVPRAGDGVLAMADFFLFSQSGVSCHAFAQIISARRRNQHAMRVRSPITRAARPGAAPV